MSKHYADKFLSLGLCVAALMFTGCGKGSDEPSTSNAENANEETETGSTSMSTTEQPGDGDGDGDGDGGPTTSGFVPDEDIFNAAACDPWVQDCPEGEKCAAVNQGGDTWNSNKCVPLKGDGQTGDPCMYDGAVLGTDDCDVGFICYYMNDENVGICIPLCTGTPDDPMCEGDFNCSITNDGSLIKCLYACDPLLQDCDQQGTGCYWSSSGYFSCYSTSDGLPTNEPCGYLNDCAPGNICLDASTLPNCAGSSCCASYCDLSAPECPIMDTECIAFFDEGTAPPGLESVGICVLPGA